MTSLKLLAISGSLKSTSSNTIILKGLPALVPPHVSITLFNGLELLPHFHPEKEEGNVYVKQFRQLLSEADGVIISTPEYAFGVPGVLKNALDWVVSSGELNRKPVAAISASPMYSGGDKAMASLLLTLSALGTSVLPGSVLSIPDILKKIGNGEVTDPATRQKLGELVQSLVSNIMAVKPAR